MKCPHCDYEDSVDVIGGEGGFYWGHLQRVSGEYRGQDIVMMANMYGCPSCCKVFINK